MVEGGDKVNKELGVFVNMSNEEKLKEIKRLEGIFPSNCPGYSFRFNKADIRNLYLGRIIALLDEFGETGDWAKYYSIDSDKMIEQHDKLLLRFIKTYKFELYSFYKEYHGIEED